MNIQCLHKRLLLFIFLINSSLLLLTGCTNTDNLVQSWKSAIFAPLGGRNGGNTSDFSDEDTLHQVFVESTADSTQISGKEDTETEKSLEYASMFEYVDDTDWVKAEWPDEYAYMKGLEWNKSDDIWSNGNIQRTLDALSVLEGSWPGVSQREIPWESLKKKSESYYGDHVWYECVYLNQIEKIAADSNAAEVLNAGKAFAVLHTSITPEDEENELLMYVMDIENLDSFYSDKDVGSCVNITGWYVGETDGKPSFVYPGLSGG